MSSGDPPSPNRRARAKPSLPVAAAPVASGEVPAPAANRSTPSKVDTSVAGDPKNSTQPVSQVGPAPKLETLGRYTILGELGRGGMGLVYLAEDTVLKRKVALKIPHFEPHKQEQMRDRFIREAQLAAQLTHRNICQVYDVGVIDDQLVMAMEYIEGRDLTAFTKPDKLLNARSAVSLIKKIAQALDVAHKKGLIHRDLKPSNIMLAQSDTTNKMIEPKVMDFGLAKSLESTGKQLTHSGMIVGTPCYMSKEQWSGKDGNLGPATDVFSLGVILYELLTGLLPYDEDKGEPATAWFVKLVTKEQIRPSVRKPGLDADLEAIVMKSIAKEVADRYATMADFAAALDGWLKGKLPTTGSTGGAPSPAMQSLLDIPFDFGQIAAAHSESPVSRNLPRRKAASSVPTWLTWVVWGALVPLGIALIFIFNKEGGVESETKAKPVTAKTPNVGVSPIAEPAKTPTKLSSNDKNSLPVGEWIDLLAMVELPKHAIHGKWERNGKELVCVPGSRNRIMIPAVTADSYELKTTFTRHTNGECMTLHLPLRDAECELLVDGWGEAIDGLHLVDQMQARDMIGTKAASRRNAPLSNGVRHELHVEVSHQGESVSIQLRIDGTDTLKWTGLTSRLSQHPSDAYPLTNSFGIRASDVTLTVHSMELRLKEGCNGYRLGDEWKTPLSVVTSEPTQAVINAFPAQKWKTWGKKKYLISDKPMSVLDARTLAHQVNGRLLTISSQEEQEFIKRESGGFDLWLSAWCAVDRVWRDERNRPLKYTNWSQGEPSNSWGVEWRAITQPVGNWNDLASSHQTPYACIEWGEEYPLLQQKVSLSSLEGKSAADSREITLPGGVKMTLVGCPPGRTGEPPPGFWIGETEVTQGQWMSLMESEPWKTQRNPDSGPSGEVKYGNDYPATYISHGDKTDGTIEADSAREFCRRLSQIEREAGRLPDGMEYRLPAYAEWEYACRAGSKTRYCFGDESSLLGDYAWFAENAERFAHPVGLKLPNNWGVKDMHGNVWEWCDNWMGKTPAGDDVFFSTENDQRERIGGGFLDEAPNCQSAERLRTTAWHRLLDVGFRIVLAYKHDPLKIPEVSATDSPDPKRDSVNLSITGTKVGDSREVTLPGGVKLTQLWCPPGTFTMGTPGATDDESPVEVTLTQGFWAAATETTQEQWTSVMGPTSKPWSGQKSVKEGPYFPANYISHGVNADGTIEPDSATAFCRNLTEIDRKAGRLPAGWKYALPTEAQWEYMCRAGTKTAYSFGDSEASLGEYAWTSQNTSHVEQYAHTVGMKKANPWGFFDLYGNVSEWCRDGYVARLPGGSDPFVPPIGSADRVNRGGGWNLRFLPCRSSYRLRNPPAYRFDLGFRVALVADTSSDLSTVPVPAEEAATSFLVGEHRAPTSQSFR